MPIIVNRMPRIICFTPKSGPVELQPGMPKEISSETYTELCRDKYFQYFEANKSIILGDTTVGVSADPAIDKTSEKKPPANLKINTGEEKAAFGKKTHHNIQTSYEEAAIKAAEEDGSKKDTEKKTNPAKKSK